MSSHIVANYLALTDGRQELDERLEWVNGEMYAMAGGSSEHAAVSSNVILAFGMAWLSRQGFGADHGEEEQGDDDDALPLMQAASVQGRSAVSGGRRARRFQVHRGRAYALPPRSAAWGGYTLHGGWPVGGRDPGGRERLCRVLARPALARGHLEETPAGLIRATSLAAYSGTFGATFTPQTLARRLAALVPPPRAPCADPRRAR